MKQFLSAATRLSALVCLGAASLAASGCDNATPANSAGGAVGTDIDLLGNGGNQGFADSGSASDATGGGQDSASSGDGATTKVFAQEFGWPCGGTGVCGGGLKCFGNVESPSALCTDNCSGDADCPTAFACSKFQLKDGATSVCTPRDFCSTCKSDAECGSGGRCIAMGSASYCSRSCDPNGTDCPRYATCSEISAGDFACVHAAGDCKGDGTLCAACASEDNCGTGGACLSYLHTKEQFCSAPCNGTTCPATFKCVDVQTATGPAKQCVPGDTKAPKCVPKLHAYLEEGDIMQDFAITGYMTGGDGASDAPMVIKLSEFAKNGYKIILLNAAAGWCGPCQQETATFKSLAIKYPELGIYQVLFDNVKQGQTPTLSFLNQWVKTLKPAGAVGIDPERNIVPINTGGSTPLNMIIDAKTLKVLKKFNGAPATGLNSVIAPYFK